MDEEAWDELIAYALGAEDSDEFFRRLARGIGRFAKGAVRAVRKAAPTIGRIARTIAPVASLIPGVGTAVDSVANVVGQLMADEASEEEALEAFAELATRTRSAVPIAAGLAARRVLGPAAARMPMRQRVAAVRTVRRAATQLVNRGGPTAIRALPRIARSVRRTGVVRRTPPAMRPRVLARTVGRVVQRSPRLRRQLAQPLARGRQVIQRTQRAVMSGASPARLVLGGSTGMPMRYGHGGYGGFGSSGRQRRISSPARPT